MKRIYVLTLILFLLSNYSIKILAQAPQAIPYQAIARDNSGNLILNQNISLRFSIRDSTANGTIIYNEIKSTTTNSLGLFNVNIGQGSVITGNFSTINWANNSKFLQVEIDLTGGSSYVNMGTQQMLSVPFALYAGSAGEIHSDGNIISNDAIQNIPDSSCSGITRTMTVTNLPASLLSDQISVSIDITHPNDEELHIFLIAPNGNVLSLARGVGIEGQNYSNTIFSDNSSINIADGTAPFSGVFKPQGIMTAQCGITPTVATFGAMGGGTINPNGIWTIKIFDVTNISSINSISGNSSAQNSGTINSSNVINNSAVTNSLPKWQSDGRLSNFSNLFDDGANVGIGTSSPSEIVDIISNNQSNPGILQITSNAVSGNKGLGSEIHLRGNKMGQQVFGGSTLGKISFDGFDVFGSYRPGAYIWVKSGGDINDDYIGAASMDIVAGYHGDGRIIIKDDGKIGVRTSFPSSNLEVSGSYTKDVTQPYESVFQVSSDKQFSSTTSISLQMGVKTDANSTNRYAGIEVDDNGTKRNLALQPNGGFVGIGTTSPAINFHIAQNQNAQTGIRIANTDPGANSSEAIYFENEDGLAAGITTKDIMNSTSAAMLIFNNRPSGNLRFNTGGLTRLYIANDGDIGIGTTSPGANAVLDVTKSQNLETQLHITNTNAQASSGEALYFVNEDGNSAGISVRDILNSSSAAMFMFNNRPSGNLRFNTASATRMIIDNSGNIGMGTLTPAAKLEVCGNVKVFGNITASGSVLANQGISCSSDFRYKKNISTLENSLDKILTLRGVNYLWRKDEFPEKQFSESVQVGFIAQEIEKIFPEFVYTDAAGFKSVDYSRLTPVLVEAIKEQQRMIESLQTDINEIKQQIELKTTVEK